MLQAKTALTSHVPLITEPPPETQAKHAEAAEPTAHLLNTADALPQKQLLRVYHTSIGILQAKRIPTTTGNHETYHISLNILNLPSHHLIKFQVIINYLFNYCSLSAFNNR